jgi:hypothetical protein
MGKITVQLSSIGLLDFIQINFRNRSKHIINLYNTGVITVSNLPPTMVDPSPAGPSKGVTLTAKGYFACG